MWSFLARLRERKLAHWAIAYLAGAWLLPQVLELLAQPFTWPSLVHGRLLDGVRPAWEQFVPRSQA